MPNQHHAFVYDGVRTPVGAFGGALSHVRTDDLAAHVIRELILRHPLLDPAAIDDVLFGCANQAGEDNRNVARMALLLAGLPYSVPGETVNRLCASGMAAVVHAKRAIESGDGSLYIAGGVEHMTRAPYVISKSAKPFGTDAKMFDSSFGWRFVNPRMEAMYGIDAMGMTAENLVALYGISRDDQDLFAVRSQLKATAAREAGRLLEEIVPVTIPQTRGEALVVSHDEFIKPGTTMEVLGKLKPAFKKDGSVTAGNASGLNDGAAALLVGAENILPSPPLARIVGAAVAGVEPRIMGIGPVEATRKVLAHTGLTMDQMDVVEINEAFAAQVLACTRQFGLADDDLRINPNGGAIALGHPLGMSGARIILTAARELQRSNARYALCTMCIGVGQGYALILEKV